MSDKTITPEGVQVEVGQEWIDLDRRSHRRTIKITRVDPINGLAYYEKPVKNRVRIDRLRRPFWEQKPVTAEPDLPHSSVAALAAPAAEDDPDAAARAYAARMGDRWEHMGEEARQRARELAAQRLGPPL